ncbi:MAG: response regulator transcription factor [Planctomycetes bacterium]|nr:response regulator transcription factor [Planctomycetota bacterium]
MNDQRRPSRRIPQVRDSRGVAEACAERLPHAGIRLLIVDDHAVVREGLEAMLVVDPGITRITTAASGADAIRACTAETPDVVLLDLRMPGGDGLGVLDIIRARWPSVRVLLLSANASTTEVLRARHAGAAGHLTKTTDRASLLAAIRLVMGGGTCFTDTAAPVVDTHGLSARELEVLSHLGRGLSNDDLGRVLGVSAETIKSHLKSVFAKLGVTGRTEAVARAFELGLVTR